VVLVLALPSAAFGATDRTVDRWSIDEGLRNNALTSLIQTRDGYLWVASWAGILRFDGVRFTPVAENLPNVHARVLLEERDGSVWVGTSGGGVFRWRSRIVQAYTTAQGLAGDDVHALARDADGRLWVGSDAGLSVIAGDRISTWRREQGLPDKHVVGLAAGRDAGMWVATPRGVCAVRSGSPRCLSAPPQSGPPSAILELADGRLMVGTIGTGVYEASAATPLLPACGGCLVGRDVTALLEAREGGVWLGLGWGGGVALLRDDRVTHYRASDGLPPFPVVSLYEDPEGSLWIATDNGGLARLRPKRVRTYSTADGLPAKVVTSIVQDTTGTIWAGVRCGPVSALRGERFEPRFAEFTRDACTHAVLSTRDGSLWIGTDGRGVFRWDGRRMHHFSREEGLSDSTASALLEDRDGSVWIGTDRGGLHRFEGGRLSRAYDQRDGVATGYIQSLAQDRDGRVWIGSNANGLTVYEAGRFKRLAPAETPARNIAALFVDSRGDLWVGTAASGLFRRRNGRYEPFGRAQGLGDALVALMLEDESGNLWVSTTRGISRLERSRIDAVANGRERSLEPIILDRSDGLLTLEGSGGGFDPSGLRDRQGRLWFSTIDGIAVVDPGAFRFNRVPPPVLIESATLQGRTLPLEEDASVQIPAGTSSIEIAYTAFSLLVPTKVRFRYRLVGFDAEWQEVGNRRVAYYSRLPPRSYTFEVIAANNDGVPSSRAASLTLTVAPFFWERLEVRLAALTVAMFGSGFGVRRFSLRRARRRLAELEREQALDRERARIARDLHDDLGARLSHIALMADAGGPADGRAQIARTAREAVQTMDELVWAVNARNDTVESFAQYAVQFAEEHLRAAGLRCRLRIQPDLGARELRAETRRHLYLAFKEAVTNAVRHAQASEVRVTLELRDGALTLEVADNGRGLPQDGGDPTGNGLRNMRDRMQAAGGTLRVESAPNRGTRLVFQTPVR
jgi:ligand-binding sensor domain-containing protein/signal transduction histidine kinase